MEKLSTLTGKYGDEGDKLLFKVLNNGDFLAKANKEALAEMNSPKLVSSIAERGLRYLVDTQEEDGAWSESLATGTGFPNVFYLRYTLYRHYFPLLVTGLYGRMAGF